MKARVNLSSLAQKMEKGKEAAGAVVSVKKPVQIRAPAHYEKTSTSFVNNEMLIVHENRREPLINSISN